MAKRLTDSRKWYDPWFRKLSTPNKLFWHFITDTCDHAGFWKVDIELASFLVGEPIIEEEILATFNNGKERIKVVRKDLWFLPTFVSFQYGKLNPTNNLHVSVIKLLKGAGAKQGHARGSLAPINKRKDKVINKVKERNNKDIDFISSLKSNPAYKGIDIDNELSKMDAWLAARPGRKKTPRFIVNWLNRVEKPIETKTNNDPLAQYEVKR